MKPIIIGVTNDGKVQMSLEEFRKHMDDAYWQGYRDNTSSVTFADYNNDKWWKSPFVCATGTDTTTTTATNAALNSSKED